jgi:hypothetical protein
VPGNRPGGGRSDKFGIQEMQHRKLQARQNKPFPGPKTRCFGGGAALAAVVHSQGNLCGLLCVQAFTIWRSGRWAVQVFRWGVKVVFSMPICFPADAVVMTESKVGSA